MMRTILLTLSTIFLTTLGESSADLATPPGEGSGLPPMTPIKRKQQPQPHRKIPGLQGQMIQWEAESIERERREQSAGREQKGEEEEEADKKKESSKGKDEEEADIMIGDFIKFGGAIEVEAGWMRDFHRKSESIIALEAAEIDFEINLTDWALGVLAFEIFNEGEDLFECEQGINCNCYTDYHFINVKEAYFTLGNVPCYPGFVTFGRLYVPFGISTGAVIGDTLSISDPLTIELFEANEDVFMVGYQCKNFYAAAYVFGGCSNRGGGHSQVDQYGATVRYGEESPELSYSFGFDFISNVFDSDELQKEFPLALLEQNAPGIAAHYRIHKNGLYFIAEYNGAFRNVRFRKDDKSFRMAPKAWQMELGFDTYFWCRPGYIAFNYSQSFNLQGFFPKTRFLATAAVWLYKTDILMAIEYGCDWDYPKSECGTGHSAHSILGQFVYEW